MASNLALVLLGFGDTGDGAGASFDSGGVSGPEIISASRGTAKPYSAGTPRTKLGSGGAGIEITLGAAAMARAGFGGWTIAGTPRT